jgi:hypothetical protein
VILHPRFNPDGPVPSGLALRRLRRRLASPATGLLLLAGISALFLNTPSATAGSSIAETAAEEESGASISSQPLIPDYRVHSDGSVTLRICFNWSCASRQHLTFTAADMAKVAQQMSLCPRDGLYDRLQRLRIGIWQMEVLAEKYQPLLANDEGVNDRDSALRGRMDCVDSASNTTTYLHVLYDLGLLPGWSLQQPKVRHRFSLLVHWTAVVVDSRAADSWSVDSWMRPNGHLPLVMPLREWTSDKVPWKPPFAEWNPTTHYSNQLCRG